MDYQGRTVHKRFSRRSDNLLNLQGLRCAVRTQEQYTDGLEVLRVEVEAG
jgi:hypothetical protein